MIKVTQGSQTRTSVYDALSRMTSVTTPEAGQVQYQYNDFNLVQQRTDARQVVTKYGYDGLNRPQTVSYNPLPSGVAPTTGVTVNYNASGSGIGQPSSVSDGAGSETYQYDSFGRLSQKARTTDTNNTYTTSYQYNSAGQLATITYPSGKEFRATFDTDGRFSEEDKINSSGGLITAYMSAVSYSPAQQATGLTLGNGVTEGYTYDVNRLQLIQQTAGTGGQGSTSLMSLIYNYQAASGASGSGTGAGNSGQLMAISAGTPGSKIAGQARDEAFTYDNLGRLATASGWSTWQRRYSYDRYGNRLAAFDATTGGNQIQSITIGTQGGAATR